MPVQTSYTQYHQKYYAGMVTDAQLVNTASRLNKGTVNIAFGKAIVTDGVGGGKLPDAASAANEFNGVCMRELNRAVEDGTIFGAIGGKDFTIVTFGPIVVVAANIVAKDDPVFMRVGATNLGDFANVAGTGVTLSVAIPGAKFLEAGNIGDLVPISLGIGG